MASTRRTGLQDTLDKISLQIADLRGAVGNLAEMADRFESSLPDAETARETLERDIADLERIGDQLEKLLHSHTHRGTPSRPATTRAGVDRLDQLSRQVGQLTDAVASTQTQTQSHNERLHYLGELASNASRHTEMLWSSKPWQAYLRLGRLRHPSSVEIPSADQPSSAPGPALAPSPPAPESTSGLTQFLPYRPESDCYLISKNPPKVEISSLDGLPLPPAHLMLGHANEKEFISWGEHHVENMRRLLGESGHHFKEGDRVLDFGCGSGRMLRHFHSLAETAEVWGVDIRSEHIMWCRHHLSPPLHFAVTTTLPHLPFEDRHFDLIYAGSVFTHIDDLADAWLLELRRILKPGGTLYFTIHDQHSLQVVLNGPKNSLAYEVLSSHSSFEEYAKSDFSMFTLWRSADSQVFYDLDYMRARLEPLFDFITSSQEAYGFQTAMIVRKP